MRDMMVRMTLLETIHRWDVFTFQWIMSAGMHRALVRLARVVSMTGDGWPYFLVLIPLYLLGYEVTTFVIVGGTAFAIERLVYFIAKRSFKRRRPGRVVSGYQSHIDASDEFSFPSGHTSAAFLMVSLLVLFYGPAFAAFYLWAVFIGLSRIILGVHFPTDILVGSMMGAGIGWSVYTAFEGILI